MGTLDLPLFQPENGGWKIETAATAGGYAYLFPEKERKRLTETNLLWTWSIAQFPVTKAASPLDKAADDYALRVGLLVRGDGEVQMPPNLQEASRRIGGNISYVLFYSATDRRDWADQCFRNPYNDRVVDCLKLADRKRSDIRPLPFSDLSKALSLPNEILSKLEVVGVWIFADSDNSKTRSKAHLYQLSVVSSGGG